MSIDSLFISEFYNDLVTTESYESVYGLLNDSDDVSAESMRFKYRKLVCDMSNDDKVALHALVTDIIENTISHVFGVLDGSTTLGSGDLDIETNVKVNSIPIDDGLQDLFWEHVQENIEG